MVDIGNPHLMPLECLVTGYLDSARMVYTHLVDDVYAYRTQLQEEYGMEKHLQLCFRTSGYHFA
jgi:hypothetical protein